MRIPALIFCAMFSGGALAQAWPTKPLRLVVPFPAGGPSDILGRVVAERLSKAHGQPVVVDNRPGAGANIGAEVVAKSIPDGYTLLLSPPGPQAANQFLYKSLGFDPKTDFSPVVIVSDMPVVFAASPKLPVGSITELVEYARKNPGKLTYASPGNGTIGHLAAELFKSVAGVDITHVPYKGSAPALQDLLAGQVDLAVDNLPPYQRFLQNGQLKPLSVTTGKRWPTLSAVPTMQQLGFAGYQASSWIGLFGPAKMPGAVVTAVNRSTNEWLSSEDGAKRLQELGFVPVGGTPQDLERIVRDDVARWGPVIKRLGVRLD